MFASSTEIMGILNITDDSFSGDGVVRGSDFVGLALERAELFLASGVSLLDIGGESTRPGSEVISEAEELSRVIPVIEAIRGEFSDVIISVDTYKSEVARLALGAGASMVNDVSGMQADGAMSGVVRDSGADVVLMHNRARRFAVVGDERLGSSYEGCDYGDVVADVVGSLRGLAESAELAGIGSDRIILDVGLGFGKSVSENLRLIRGLPEVKALGYRVMLGASRKSFIGKVLDREVGDRLAGDAACVAMGVVGGVDIVRVHDVGFMADVVRMTEAIMSSGSGDGGEHG